LRAQATPDHPSKQVRHESREFKRAKFLWLDEVKACVARHELPPTGFLLAYELFDRFNEEQGGAAWPSYKTLADEIGTDEAYVLRLLHRMVELDLLRAEWGKRGRGHSGRYWMVPKLVSGQVQKVSPDKFKTCQGAEKTCQGPPKTCLETSDSSLRPSLRPFTAEIWNGEKTDQANGHANGGWQRMKAEQAMRLLDETERYLDECEAVAATDDRAMLKAEQKKLAYLTDNTLLPTSYRQRAGTLLGAIADL
jgi:hypothetical protein